MNTSDIKRLDKLVEKHLFGDCTQNESEELDQLYDTFTTELNKTFAEPISTAR